MTLPLVRLDNVDVALDGQTVLRGLNWQLHPGEHWAVLGGNGSGKSTFLKLVRGELWPAPGRGQRVFALDGDEQDSAVGVQEAMPLVSPEYQDRCRRLDWTRTVRQVVESGVSGGDILSIRLTAVQRVRVRAAAELLGIHPWWGRDIRELSTGELRRTLLARALAGSPRVLVCDEVCDGLDAASRGNLLQALDRVARAGTLLLFTTHRREELLPAITHQLVLEAGRIVEQGPLGGRGYGPAWSASDLSRSKRISRLVRSLRPRLDRDSGERIPPRKISRIEPVNQRAAPRSAGIPAGELRMESLAGKDAGAPRLMETSRVQPLISIERASVYLGRRRVLHQVTWQLHSGQHWAITGPNGSGKTTLLKLISGDLHPALGGRVKRFEFTRANTLWELRRRIGCVSPELQANYRERLTGAEVIATGYRSTVGFIKRPSSRNVRSATLLAEELGFGALAARLALEMSYGEYRKILIARALVHNPALLILDEPFDGLDAPARTAMARVLEKAVARGASLIVVTHHADDLPACTTHRAHLEGGRIVDQGPMARNPKLETRNAVRRRLPRKSPSPSR